MTISLRIAYILLLLVLNKYRIFSYKFLHRLKLLANNMFEQSTP